MIYEVSFIDWLNKWDQDHKEFIDINPDHAGISIVCEWVEFYELKCEIIGDNGNIPDMIDGVLIFPDHMILYTNDKAFAELFKLKFG